MLVTIANDTKIDLTTLLGAGDTDFIQIEHEGEIGKEVLAILTDVVEGSIDNNDAFVVHWDTTSINSIRSIQGIAGSKVWLINPYPEGNAPIAVRVFSGV
jgi:hypothetical protein